MYAQKISWRNICRNSITSRSEVMHDIIPNIFQILPNLAKLYLIFHHPRLPSNKWGWFATFWGKSVVFSIIPFLSRWKIPSVGRSRHLGGWLHGTNPACESLFLGAKCCWLLVWRLSKNSAHAFWLHPEKVKYVWELNIQGSCFCFGVKNDQKTFES